MGAIFSPPSAPDLPAISDRDPTDLDPVQEANRRRTLLRQQQNATVASMTIPRDVPAGATGVGPRPPSTT